MPSFTDLQTYRRCPRLYRFKLLGYQPIEIPEPIQTGQLAHTGIASFFKGLPWAKAILDSYAESYAKLERIDNPEKKGKAQKELELSYNRANSLAKRYIEHYATDYSACLVEPELTLGNVICHPDLIAYYQEQRVIVDYKTSKSPDIRFFDCSGQVDLYAYVAGQISTNEDAIQLVIYDIISEEGIFRHARPPRIEAGQALYDHINTGLSQILCQHCLDEPHLQFDCPNRCQFWLPCHLLETGTWQDALDYLENNYIKEAKVETE